MEVSLPGSSFGVDAFAIVLITDLCQLAFHFYSPFIHFYIFSSLSCFIYFGYHSPSYWTYFKFEDLLSLIASLLIYRTIFTILFFHQALSIFANVTNILQKGMIL